MLAARAEGERAEAVDCAKAAAPYVHPKLAPTSPPAVSPETETDYTSLSDEELGQLESLLSKVLKPASGDEAPKPLEGRRRGRYPRAVSSGAQ
jgi:hypothetical protein